MELLSSFVDLFGQLPSLQARAPGRVNLLGEHVDYNEGPVLPMAIDRAVQIVASPARDETIRIYAMDLQEKAQFRVSSLEAKIDSDGRPLPRWAHYPAGVVWVLQQAGFDVRGFNAAFTSDIPIGAGLSSSAAVEVAFARTCQALSGWSLDPIAMAQLCQKAENRYVGVACGLMDQFASACGVADHALYFDTRSLEWEAVPLIPGTTIVIADSGVRHDHLTSAYNERRAACEQAVALLRQKLPGLHSLRDISSTEFSAYSDLLPPVVRMRAEHVVKEIARVESARTALHRRDSQAFGALMYAGHASLRDLYQISTPELDRLVDLARRIKGCIGARLTGGGFGGCTVNLVETSAAESFIQELQQGYQAATGRKAQVYLCRASQGASATFLAR